MKKAFWVFVLLGLAICCVSCVTAKEGDIRLINKAVCLKGEQTVKKTGDNYYSTDTKCEQYLYLCHLQRLGDDGVWETLVTVMTKCEKAPPLNLEGTSGFDFTKKSSITGVP